MKILFDHALPFALAHGGFQTQIEETKAALERRGIEVEHVRWWDDRQKGDLIHAFGIPSLGYAQMAKQQRIPIVSTHLFTATCNRSITRLRLQGLGVRLCARSGGSLRERYGGEAFRTVDRMIVGLEAERRVLEIVYGLRAESVVKVPLGLNHDFLGVKPLRQQPFLITTGTITDRKRSIELARMAREAEVPVLFVGKPYSLNDGYWKEFSKLVDDRFVLHRDHVADRGELIELLRSSRGFVIYSQYENWCLSAHEAAACGLPLLLPDMPWSRECFGNEARYLHARTNPGNVARLREFYDACPKMNSPGIHLHSWDECASILDSCYQSLLA